MLKNSLGKNYLNNIILNIDDIDGNGYYDVKDFLNMKNEEILKENNGKRFDIVLMNPPYSSGLHIDFLNKVFNIIDKESGKLVTIQPSNRSFTDLNKINNFKKLIHENNITIKDVELNNYGNEFKIRVDMNLMILTVDQSYNDSISCNVYGEKFETKDMSDINLIGRKNIIDSIDKKIAESGLETPDKYFFIGKKKKYEKQNIGKHAAFLRNSGGIITMHGYNSKADWVKDDLHNEEYYGLITQIYVHKNKNEIMDHPEFQEDKSHPNGWIYYDKEDTYEKNKEKLENFKYFIKNSYLAHYLNWTHNGANNMKYIPFYINKFNDDNDIYKFFNFDKHEIDLIEKTCKKIIRGAQFFKEYIGG